MRIAIAGATGLVGRPLTAAARAAGHEVVELSRSQGVDLTTGAGLDLTGVDAVVDVTSSPTQDPAEATGYFTSIAEHLGDAATAAGARRTVVLSIIGIDVAPEPYYRAKLAQERATQQHAPGPAVLRTSQFLDFPRQMLEWNRQGDEVTIPDMLTQPVAVSEVARVLLELAVAEHAPGAVMLRAAQFLDFPRQMLEWNRQGDEVTIPDMLMQPVAVDEVVRVLLELATAQSAPAITELAGPKRERLPDLVARLGSGVTIHTAPVSDEVRDGALLPGPDAIIAGGTFDDYLASYTNSSAV